MWPLGLFLNIAPLIVALVVAIVCSLFILKLKTGARLSEDTSIGIFSSAGMPLGIVLAGVSGKLNVDLFGYLFGNILAIDTFEVVIAVVLAVAVIVLIGVYYQELLFQTFDPESAQTAGIRVGLLNGLLAVLTSITVGNWNESGGDSSGCGASGYSFRSRAPDRREFSSGNAYCFRRFDRIGPGRAFSRLLLGSACFRHDCATVFLLLSRVLGSTCGEKGREPRLTVGLPRRRD